MPDDEDLTWYGSPPNEDWTWNEMLCWWYPISLAAGVVLAAAFFNKP